MSSTNKSSPSRNESGDGDDGGGGDIAVDLFPFLRVYNDGRIKKFVRHATVPASPDERSPNGIVTKDVVVDDETSVSVRLFLPVDAAATAVVAGRRLLPLVLYVHGGAFCSGSASAPSFHRYAESLAARAAAVVVSVDYRLAPEHPMPAGYDDAWAALRWVVSSRHSDPWVSKYADTTCMFLAGESAGANIVHNVALRAGGAGEKDDDGIDIEGIILLQPCFWGTERLPCEKPAAWRATPMFLPERLDALWPFATAGAAGNDDPRIDPPAEAIASLPCRRALVSVATEDVLRDRGRRYAAWLRDGAWGGEATLVESDGEDHCFHLSPKPNPNAVALMDHVAEFIAKGKTATPTSLPTAKQRRRRRCTLHGTGTENTTSSAAPTRGVSGGPRCTAQTELEIQQAGSGIGSMMSITSPARHLATPIRTPLSINSMQMQAGHRTRASGGSMRTSKISPAPRSDIAVDLRPFLVVYNDGRTRFLVRHETVAASDEKESANGVVTKDVVIDDETGVSVRVFLPVDAAVAAAAAGRRLPLVVYVHGGAFCTGSASAVMFHRYAESLSARAAAVVVSVDYRLAPQHPIPAAYDDAWAALRWAASPARHLTEDTSWVGDYADRSCVFLAGESVGANIVHNVAVRAGRTAARNGGEVDDDDIDIEGMILLQPYFWGTERLPCETPDAWRGAATPTREPKLLPERVDALWPYVTAGAANNGDPRIDPPPEAMASLPCRRALVSVATEDVLRGRGRRYAAQLRDYGGAWGGGGSDRATSLVESKCVDHCFHLLPEFSSHTETGVLMDRVAMFIAKGRTPPISMLMEERVTKKTTSSAVPGWRVSRGPRCTAQTAVGVRRAWVGMGNTRLLPRKAQKYHHVPAAVLRRSVFKSYYL
uniref:Alpha/beta hydrolase fold-3 domain-containing protein n=1 Tax=Oryza punctata TaxID=4537 RepID=A0A0E0M1L7_ORYPU